eukprot:COSAG02_NODE_27191_length_615_cov_1.042636_2_plen_29_part_01
MPRARAPADGARAPVAMGVWGGERRAAHV